MVLLGEPVALWPGGPQGTGRGPWPPLYYPSCAACLALSAASLEPRNIQQGISNVEGGILGCCHKKTRKDAKASGNPNTLFLVVNWRPILTSQPVSFSIRNSLLDILLFLQQASIANQGRMGRVGRV